MQMDFWKDLLADVIDSKCFCLLVVVSSTGSSPGRQGFKMLVGENEVLHGSIGGGFMEHKLVELARSLLKKGPFLPFLKKQIHRASAPKDRSGMICSGEQTMAFYYLSQKDHVWIASLVQDLAAHKPGSLTFDEKQIAYYADMPTRPATRFVEQSEKEWLYQEQPGPRNTVYIIGAGHVGLALSKTMRELDFRVCLFDDRADLNTLQQNTFAHQKKVIAYENIATDIEEGPNTFVVLMSFGYRSDELVLRELLGKKFRYFGVMGSEEKMKVLLASLAEEGYPAEALRALHTPIGLSIHSQTPAEIAISIAAEIIKVKNEPN